MSYIQVPNSFGQGGGEVEVTADGQINLKPASGQGVRLADDVELQFGDAPDYWWEYESANTRLRLRSSDIDGGGTDGDILRVADGGQATEFLGQLIVPHGGLASPAITFSGDSDRTGIYSAGVGTNSIRIVVGSANSAIFQTSGPILGNNADNIRIGDNDLQLHRDAADTLALRRSDNNNVFRIYNEFTDASNYSRLALVTADGAYTISPQAAGTGTLRGLTLGESGVNLGFFGATPVAQPSAYSPTNVTTDRTYDANSTSTAELADVLGTLISDLQSLGLIG